MSPISSRKEQKEQRRRQIMDVALDEFIAKGFYGTSTTEIAKLCNMSSGLMFHYFPSKEALYLALLQNASEGMAQMMTGLPPQDDPMDIFDSIAATTVEMFDRHPQALKVFVFLKQAMFAHTPATEAQSIIGTINPIEQMVPLVEKGQQMGTIRQGEPLGLTALFFSSLQGMAEMLHRYPHLPVPKPEYFTAFLRKETEHER